MARFSVGGGKGPQLGPRGWDINGALKPPSGSTRRSNPSVLRDFISVADFGADRTGNTACTTALRNAIAEAQALAEAGFNASKGATVRMPTGRYLLDSKIQIPEAVTIVGDGYAQTAIRIAAGFPDNAVFEPATIDSTQEFIGLQGFILYGTSTGGTVPSVHQANAGVATTVNTGVTLGNMYPSFSLVANGSLASYATNGTINVGASPVRVRYQSINTGTNTFNGCVVVSGLNTAINAGDAISPVTTDNIVGIACVGVAGPTYIRDVWLSTFTGEDLLIVNCNASEFQNIVANYSDRDCILYTGARASNYFRAIAGQYSGVSNVGNRTAGFHLQGQNGSTQFSEMTSLDGFYSEQTSDNACGVWLDNYGSFSGQNINLQGGSPVNPGTQTAVYISASVSNPLTQDASHAANISLRNIHCAKTSRVLLNDTVRGYATPANTTTLGTSRTRYDTEDASPRAKATPTYSASITPDCSQGDWQTITVTNGTAFTINAPVDPPGTTQTRELVIEVLNSSGGAMGVITWNAVFVFAGLAWTNPATTKKRYARFQWNGSAWVCQSIAAADY